MSGVQVPRYATLCRLCRRELLLHVASKGSGRVYVEMRCPLHGTLGDGDRFYQSYMLEVQDDDCESS